MSTASPYLKIESGIPLPIIGKQTGRLKYNWPAMKVGDSMLLPSRSAAASGHIWARNNGCKFVVRKMQQQPFGYRVWRVA